MKRYQPTRIDAERLRVLRNQVSFTRLFDHLHWPWKHRYDGVILFVCPVCGDSLSSVNPKTNLARCFPCARNWNPIDFTMHATQMDFLDVVAYLESTFLSSARSSHPDP